MTILLIILVLLVLVVTIWLLIKLVKWGFEKKRRLVWGLSILTAILLGVVIKTSFFTKMEFMQSQVYHDLYLIKNPLKDREKMNIAIREKVIERMNSTLNTKNQELNTLRFYEYNTGDWGENGTVYFLNKKERSEGMLPELLEYYPEFLIARFELHSCEIDSTNNWGKLDYYKDHKLIRTDTLLNSCNK